MLRLGLTGGIGSGKSTVARFLSDWGAAVLDADAMARACTQAGGSAMADIRRQFGASFVSADGAMNRERMREHVLAQPQAKRLLESIVHPLVHAEIQSKIRTTSAKSLVLDIPLLVESGHWRGQLDRVLVVDCPVETQVHRVMERSGWAREQVDAVIALQSPRERRLACADAVIWNEGLTLDRLRVIALDLARRLGL